MNMFKIISQMLTENVMEVLKGNNNQVCQLKSIRRHQNCVFMESLWFISFSFAQIKLLTVNILPFILQHTLYYCTEVCVVLFAVSGNSSSNEELKLKLKNPVNHIKYLFIMR